jgi:hypothetical protein
MTEKKPTKSRAKYHYKPEMCEQIIELGKQGASQKAMFSSIGISSSAAQRFKKDHPDFAEALDRAVTESQAYYERLMLANIGNKNFNSRLVELILRGQFSETYREDRTQKVDLKAEVTVDFSSAVNELIAQLKQTS